VKVFVTGVSKGLGKALAELYLLKGYNVIGIGRSHNVNHPNFDFVPCDLADIEQVKMINFGSIDEETLFINNAGVIGSIGRISELNDPDPSSLMAVNTVAPMILSSKIANSIAKDKLLTVVNISSGAGKRPIPSWAAYCASKAALDLFSQTFLLEEKERGRAIRVFAISPGVINTAMQEEIRSSKESDFSSLKRFVELKENHELRSPEEVAKLIADMLEDLDHDDLEVLKTV
jgi:benzil reductase ((S)-benzoin forming)